MDDKIVHNLAIAYAHATLIKFQQEYPERSGSSEEIRSFLKAYHFALIHIPEEDSEIDLSTLA